MPTIRLFAIILLLLLLPACEVFNQDPSATVTEQATQPAALPTLKSTATADTAGTPEATRTAVAVKTPEAMGSTIAALPEPVLFDATWDEREIFRAGLIETEQDVLDGLPGASIYHMDLTIDEPTAVSGQMQVRYTNQEGIPLDEIYFHLFPNKLGGSITIGDVTVNGQAVQSNIQQDVLRVPLEAALDPGQAVVVQMDFTTTVPLKDESTKYSVLAFDEDILALPHFYPMIAAYDDEGWHIEPAPPHGDETYADMSFYLVRLSAPEEQVVVANGVEIDHSETGSTQTITVAAGPMRDFYLAMSDRFAVISGNAGPVRINSYAPQELQDGAQFALDVAVNSLSSFNQRFGPYPYSELDIVSTPVLALGVEYPGLFVNAIRIYDLGDTYASGVPNAVMLESTTAHEAAHQWFYNLVGNDQLNEPWLDEATAQYATWLYYIDQYGEQNAQGYFEALQARWARNDFADIPIGMPAKQYSGPDYGAIVYGRGPIFLNDLAQEMGQENFDAFLRDYSETFRWQVATSEDFQMLAEQHCQCDLGSLFDEAVYAN